ncbi:MAG TPA: YhdP family protein [Tahibacter sp.]|uniref:YhdP family protein n=1 Tax=Tahibacter sp. TaxID=2056211 RepID=UPI002B65D45F|nr:YhdP family protein [Tahibacter sp.]HSX59877.1 YhdP family protein [Tahibacter sp.]
MTPWRRRLRRARIALTLGLACLVILAAVFVGLLRLLLPQVGLHKARVEALLSDQLQRPVSIDQVQGYWGEGGPLLRLDGVHVASADVNVPPLVIPQAELGIDLGAWLGRTRRWSEFRIAGINVDLVRRDDGSWQMSGLVAGDGGSSDSPLLALGAVVLRDARIRVVDAAQGIDAAVRINELRLLNEDGRHRVLAVLRRDAPQSKPLQFVAELDAELRSGNVYLGGDSLDLAALAQGFSWQGRSLRTGSGKLQMWARLRDAAPVSIHAAVDVGGIEAAPPADAANGAKTLSLAQLRGVARWTRDTGGWTFDLADFHAARAGTNPIATALTLRREGESYALSAPQVDLASIAALLPFSPERATDWPARAALQGQLRGVSLRYAGRDDFDVSAVLDGLSFLPVDKVPGFTALHGELYGDAAALVLDLPAQSSTLNYARKFRQPLALQRLAGRIAAFRLDEGGWRVETDALDVDAPGVSTQLRGSVELRPDGGKPLLDLYAVVLPSDVPAAKQFWPIGDMSQKAMDWLDRGLVAGTIDGGRAAIHCDLDDWPIRDYSGQFKARAEISGLTLDYNPAWPRAEGVSVVAEFLNSSMHAETEGGRVLGTTAKRAVADIPSFKDAVLSLDVEGEGAGPDLLAVINASPLGTRFAKELKGLEIGGMADVKFHLDLPFAPDIGSTVKGEIALSDAAIVAKKWDTDFAHASGKIFFTNTGMRAGPLALQKAGHPAAFSLALGDDVADRTNAVEARLEGHLPMELVFKGATVLEPWWPRFSGRSDWTITLAVPRADTPAQLTLRSELRGTAIDLPAPLDKPAGDAMPLEVRLNLPMEGSPLSVAIADVLQMRARLPDAQREFAGAIALGNTPPEQIPDAGLTVVGRGRRLDLSGWAGVGVGAGAGPSLLRSVDLRADRALIGVREFADLGLVLARQPDQVGISFSGAQLQGTLQIPTVDLLKRGITAQFEHLHWPDPPRPAGAPPDDTDPLDGVVPSAIPPLHLWIGDFRLGSANLGETRLESLPNAEGMRIEQFETHSDDMEMHVRGQWSGDGKRHRSDVDLDLTSENLGRMLAALGFAGLFDGGQTLAHVDAYWNGSPASFALSRLEGKLKLSVNAGRILDVEPGMGRLFGLFSVREIPRRLALDFGDFFRTGMSFTSINGEFRLGDGNAQTENLHIASPAADIRIRGRTGLKARDYDQQMVVTPRVGGALTVVGALAGGPAGAAAGLAVQTLFNKAINQVTTAKYHVTGSWEKPEITLVSREGGRQRSAQREGVTPVQAPPVPGEAHSTEPSPPVDSPPVEPPLVESPPEPPPADRDGNRR